MAGAGSLHSFASTATGIGAVERNLHRRLVSCEGHQFRENILITHRGMSGPAILQISSYWRPGLAVVINLLPDHDALELLRDQNNREVTLANFLSQFLPRRFATGLV